MLIDVKNASKKPHIAEKAAWLLRENGFDVLDWSNFPADYDKTLIKDYKGNFTQALRIAKVLKVGRVIVSYDSKIYYDIDVFIGEDCAI
jgi:cyclopropane fatty-acyl-phospholipid synthase-like methyltransferase